MQYRNRILAHRQLGIVLITLALILMLWLARSPLAHLMNQRAAIVHYVAGFGLLSPLVFIALYAIQIIIAPIPGGPLSLAAGYLFGSFWGTLYCLFGIALGALGAGGLARRVGRPTVQRWVGEKRLDIWEERFKTNSPVTWVIAFLLPVSDVVYYIAGISGVRMRWLVLAALLGRAPTLLVENWFGATVSSLPLERLLNLAPLLAIPLLVAYFRQRALRQVLARALDFTRHALSI